MMLHVWVARFATALMLATGLAGAAWADEDLAEWEQAVEAAIEEQDKELRDATRQGTTARVVTRYMSQLSRRESALNLYLVGRALFFDKRFDESMRYLTRTLATSPGFWYAERGMALLYLQKRDIENARVYLDRVRSRRPGDLDLLLMDAKLRLLKQNLPESKALINQYLDQRPDDLETRLLLVEVLRLQEDLPGAVRELGIIVRSAPEDPRLRMSYADGLARLEQFKEAADQFERVLRLEPEALEVYDMLEVCYVQSKNWKGLERTLRRKKERIDDPKELERIEQGLEMLAKGPPPDAPDGASPKWEENPINQLLAQCLDPKDAEVRYKGLVTYFDKQIPYVPLLLYARLDPEREPDPRCRWMLLRILGQLEAIEAAPRIASGLFDPDMRVRRVAADELGKFRTKAMLIYLEPYFMGLPVEGVPDDPAVREALESEYNAAAESVRNLTGFRDQPVGERWVAMDEMAANRGRWRDFFSGELGKQALLDAVRAFPDLQDPYPETSLIYRVLVEDDIAIVKAAYDVMLAHADAAVTGEDPHSKERWEGFPRYDSASFSEEKLKLLRERVQGFFADRRQRLSTAKAGD